MNIKMSHGRYTYTRIEINYSSSETSIAIENGWHDATWWGYELVIIVEQQNIKVEILDVIIRSELFVILSKEPSDNELQPKGGGGSFPGGISNLTTSLPFESTKTFKWIIISYHHLHKLR